MNFVEVAKRMTLREFREIIQKYDQDCEICFFKPEHQVFERGLELLEVRERKMPDTPKPLIIFQLT